jgi:SNF family Na+-dependent transporter
VLEITRSIDEPGSLNVKLTVCLLIAWVLVYFCIWRGIRTTGKVVYVTATLPYVILVILLVKGLTLPGATNGILYYITPQWNRLKDPAVTIAMGFSLIIYSLM